LWLSAFQAKPQRFYAKEANTSETTLEVSEIKDRSIKLKDKEGKNIFV
jgi:hypothetical protein